MAFLWFLVVALCLIMYVVLDGYDLGIGINLLFDRDQDRRRESLEVVATAWDGNESWLILLGVSIWAGFPRLYGAADPHNYLPLIIMLFALIGRGAAIEMISSSDRTPKVWMWVFTIGSLVAALAQGVVFGALTGNVHLDASGAFIGGAFDFLTPYSVLTGLAAVLLYAALGAGFMRIKADGELRERSGRHGRVLTIFAGILSGLAALSIGGTDAPLVLDSAARIVPFVVFAIIALAGAVTAVASFTRPETTARADQIPYVALVVSTVAGFLAYAWTRYPTLAPPSLTVHSEAAPSVTLIFLLIGVGANIPLVLFYNWYAHHIFRGRYRQQTTQRRAGVSASQNALAGPSERTAP